MSWKKSYKYILVSSYAYAPTCKKGADEFIENLKAIKRTKLWLNDRYVNPESVIATPHVL